MMKKMIFLLLSTFCMAVAAEAQEGLASVKSSHDVVTTADRLENVLKEKGMILFARIDYAANAASIDPSLKPTLLLIFSRPAAETALIQRSRSIGLDLPLKALIWEDRAGVVWISYNAPDYLARRHGITEMDDVIQQMQQDLTSFVMAAALP